MAARPKRGRALAVAMPATDSERLSIRQIKNGWLINRSGTRKGKYFDEEEFSAERPKLTVDAAAKKGARR